jgi:hypothetical protein
MYLNRRKREQQPDIIDHWSIFNQTLIDWGEEISDIHMKHEYIHFCASEMSIRLKEKEIRKAAKKIAKEEASEKRKVKMPKHLKKRAVKTTKKK